MALIQVSNCIWITGWHPADYAWLCERVNFHYTQTSKEYGKLKRERVLYSVVQRQDQYLVLPYGCLPDVRELYPPDRHTYEFGCVWDHDVITESITLPEEDDRDAQRRALEAVYASFREHVYGVCLIAPCGSGKTRMGIRLLAQMRKKTLVIVHTKELLNQWVEKLHEALPNTRIGTIMNGKFTDGEVVVGLVQTLYDMAETLRSHFSVVIMDEAHHAPARTFGEVMNVLNPTVKIGLTASERRSDHMHPLLFATIGPVVNRIGQDQLNAEGVIMAPIIRYVTTPFSWEGDATREYTKMLSMLCGNDKRNSLLRDIIQHYIDAGRNMLVLSARVGHLKELQKSMPSWVYGPTQILTGQEKRKDRELAMERLVKGFPCTFATTQLAKEGLDAPLLDTLLWATPTRDLIVTQQAVGRIQRTAPGKKTPLVIDLVDANVGVLLSQSDSRRSVYRRLQGVEE